MKEIFVIYNKKTGFFDGGAGKINRNWDIANADGSTMSERIAEILAKNPDREVIYLPNQKLSDPEQHKIKDGKIVKLTAADKKAIRDAKPKSEIELLKERVAALEG